MFYRDAFLEGIGEKLTAWSGFKECCFLLNVIFGVLGAGQLTKLPSFFYEDYLPKSLTEITHDFYSESSYTTEGESSGADTSLRLLSLCSW